MIVNRAQTLKCFQNLSSVTRVASSDLSELLEFKLLVPSGELLEFKLLVPSECSTNETLDPRCFRDTKSLNWNNTPEKHSNIWF